MGSDRGAGRSDSICLLNGNRRWNPANFIYDWLIHPVQELASIGTESFNVTSLAFCVDCIEGKTRFAASAGTRDDMEFVEIEIEINSLKIVLTRAADDDRIPNKLCRSRHKTAKVIRDKPTRQLRMDER